MTGRLYGKGLRLERAVIDEIEARIPDGHTVAVNGKASTAYWLLYLHGPNGGRVFSGPVRVSRGVPLAEACRFALERWAKRVPA